MGAYNEAVDTALRISHLISKHSTRTAKIAVTMDHGAFQQFRSAVLLDPDIKGLVQSAGPMPMPKNELTIAGVVFASEVRVPADAK